MLAPSHPLYAQLGLLFSVTLWFYIQNVLKNNPFMFSNIFVVWREMLNEQMWFGCRDIKEQVVGDRGVLPSLTLS